MIIIMRKAFFNSFVLFIWYLLLTFLVPANAQQINYQQIQEHFERVDSIKPKKAHQSKSSSKELVLRVSNQEDFDLLNERINNAIEKGAENIRIKFSSGVFFYKNNHLFLNMLDSPNTRITLEGHKTILTGKHISSNETRNRKRVIKALEASKPQWSELQQLDNLVEVVNEDNCLCRIPNALSLVMQKGMKIELTEWFCRKTYDVIDIKDGFVYFFADGMTYRSDWKTYTINMDYVLSNNYPRYRIKYPTIESHEAGIPSRFLWIFASAINSIKITNISFIGSGSSEESLLYISYSKCGVFEISHCNFELLENEVVRSVNTPNLYFHNNKVVNCEAGVLSTDNSSPNVCVEKNSFIRTGLNGNMNYAVSCYGSDFLVKDNIFQDFNYVAINSGMRLKWNKDFPCNGIIENNVISYSSAFIEQKNNYTLIDGGAIYLDSYIDEIIVRYNFIYNYSGMGSNRGIYLDDGAGNVDIFGNILINITDGDAIFSWRFKGAEKIFPSANDNIHCMYNIIQEPYIFDEIESSNCTKGRNLILGAEDAYKSKLINFQLVEPDVFDTKSYYIKNNKIVLSKETVGKVNKLPCYKGMKKWIRQW